MPAERSGSGPVGDLSADLRFADDLHVHLIGPVVPRKVGRQKPLAGMDLSIDGALRSVAAALQHDPAAQCLGLSPPGPRGWSVGGQKPNLESGVIHGGRSVVLCEFKLSDKRAK